jgi:hypothetical protein
MTKPIISSANGIILHHYPRNACVWLASANSRLVLATAHYRRLGSRIVWQLRVPGHTWPCITQGAAAIGADLPVKSFRTWQECNYEVIRLIGRLA